MKSIEARQLAAERRTADRERTIERHRIARKHFERGVWA